MSQVTLDGLDERTKAIGESLQSHIVQDDKNFGALFSMVKRVEISQAKSGVITAAVVIFSQVLCSALVGAWVKGLF